MDYSTDLPATFLDVDHVNYIAVYGRVRELSECICVPKINGGRMDLERDEGELMTEFSFLGELSL